MENRENRGIKVSVVVPVYNMQDYLEECMDSILAQTLKEIEIICVDDGSTDDSPAILDGYVAKDGRIRVIHIANGGYGHAVNLGIDHAQGKYISIVEPDDYIEEGMLERLYAVSEEYNLDMVNADCMHFSGEGESRIFQKSRMINDDSLYNTVINPLHERKFLKAALSIRQDSSTVNFWNGTIFVTMKLREHPFRMRDSDFRFWHMQNVLCC